MSELDSDDEQTQGVGLLVLQTGEETLPHDSELCENILCVLFFGMFGEPPGSCPYDAASCRYSHGHAKLSEALEGGRLVFGLSKQHTCSQ